MNKFFLKDFFKTHRPEEKYIEASWGNLRKKTKPYEKNIQENIKKIGGYENINFLNLQKKPKEIYNKYQNYWKRHKTVKQMRSGDLKNLFLILFPNPREGVEYGLYENPPQFDDFLSALLQKRKPLYLRKLISELLYHYPEPKNHEPENILFDRLNKIYKNLDREKSSNRSLFTANRCFYILERHGPSEIAKNILNIETPLDELLPKLWLKEKHLHHGIGNKIVTELCHGIQKLLKNQADGEEHQKIQTDKKTLNRFLEYLSGEKTHNSAPLVLKSHKAYKSKRSKTPKRYSDIKPIASALLNPFETKNESKNEAKKPEKSIQKAITQFLDRHIGDPRFFSEKWIDMPKEKAIFLRWKIGETIRDFLELLSHTAEKDRDANRMWRYRKEFIESYLDAGHIMEAWIVLGKEAYKNRSKFLKKKSDDYGMIDKGNPQHSALIYQIGGLIVSEWNYNGKVRIWNEGNKNTLKFYKKKYSRENLIKKPNQEITHSWSETYSWQKKLSAYIYKYTSIETPENLQKKMVQD